MATAKKPFFQIAELEKAIFDGLEKIKAVGIQMFDTEGLSALFERVAIASGNSNRQTKSLAMSVSESVKKAGFPKPRIEGEENGEWIIVDCGAAVVHIMQPVIREYYNLEELWGGKLVAKASKPAASKTAAKTAQKIEDAEIAVKAAAKNAPAKKAATKTVAKTSSRATTKAIKDAPAPKVVAKKTVAKKVASKTLASSAPATKVAAKKVAAKKAPAKTVAAKKAPAKAATPAKTAAIKKAPAKKAVAKKS